MPESARSCARSLMWLPAILFMGSSLTFAQAPPASTAWLARNLTRVESWRFFEPPPGGGDPTSTYLATRFYLGVQRIEPRVDLQAAAHIVQLGWLPELAAGPGPLGLGAVYFDHAGSTHPGEIYLKYLNARFKGVLPGLSLQVGRFGYASGAEGASGVAKIEAVKRLRIDSRMVGEFEFSFFQRSFDGVRADYARGRSRVTAAALFPTQGGFEEDANRTLSDVGVLTGVLTLQPSAPIPRTEWQIFSYRYDDDRRVAGRPDNSGAAAVAADVDVITIGTTLVTSRTLGAGEFDAAGWFALQRGQWYELDHRAHAVSAEAGYQWVGARGRPWVRGGWLGASGDGDASDNQHETFFQMLPTVRRQSLSATYSQMNLQDLFVQIMMTPTSIVSVRADLHSLRLSESADRWYFGSGATQNVGRVFGFGTRPSSGARDLGTVLEGSVDVRIRSRWTLGGYLGSIHGGKVVTRTFAGKRLLFGFVESTFQL
jgi:Alginate export